MNEATKLLPIGSVVMLNNGTKEVMITGFYTVSEKNPNTIYDYCGCMYPEGIVASDQNLLFNHNQITKVFYIGYNGNKEKEFKQKLENAIKNVENTRN